MLSKSVSLGFWLTQVWSSTSQHLFLSPNQRKLAAGCWLFLCQFFPCVLEQSLCCQAHSRLMNNSHLLLHILLNSSPDWLLDIAVSQQVVSVCMEQLSHNMLFSIALTHTHTHSDWEQHASCCVECDDLCANGRINTRRCCADQVTVPAMTSVWTVPVLQLWFQSFLFFKCSLKSRKFSKPKNVNVKIKWLVAKKKRIREILLAYHLSKMAQLVID